MEGISFVKKEGNFNERDFSFKIDSDVFDAVGRVDGDQYCPRIFFHFVIFFSIIKKFFYESVLMKVGEGEAARTNLGEISTTNPFFPLTGPSIGGPKVLSTTSLVNE